VYKCDDYYFPAWDGGIAYNCSDLNIDWKNYFSWEFIISDKDTKHPSFWEFCKNNPF
jgi:dTDP-4-dehydrorhamnose 3,5-epimerase